MSLRRRLSNSASLQFGSSAGSEIKLSARRVSEDAGAGEVIGGLRVTAAGDWTFSLLSGHDAGGRVAISGGNLVTTSTQFDYETATSHPIRVRAVRSSPYAAIESEFTLSVLNVTEQPSLVALGLSAYSYDLAAPAGAELATIQNKTTGSTITIDPPDARFAISGDGTKLLKGLGGWAAGGATIGLVETLVDSPNSPFSTELEVTAAGVDTTPTLTPGSIDVGSWETTDPAALGIGGQGSSAHYTYPYRAIACWTEGQFDTHQDIRYVGVAAWKKPTLSDLIAYGPRGIKEVWFSVNNGPWTVVNELTNHPVHGRPGYYVKINPALFPASAYYEVRAIAVPRCGQPFVLQGDPVPVIGRAGGNGARMAYNKDMWSLFGTADKNDGLVPRKVIYKAPPGSGNDAYDGSTRELAVASYDRAEELALAWAASRGTTDLGGLEIRHTAGLNHRIPHFSTARPGSLATTQWVTFTRDPAASADQVRFVTNPAGSHNWTGTRIRWAGVTSTVMLTAGEHARYEKCDVDGSGYPRIVGLMGGYNIPSPGYPGGPKFVDDSWGGYCEILECNFKDGVAGWATTTLCRNVLIDGARPWADVNIEGRVYGGNDCYKAPKALLGCTIKNYFKLVNDPSHADMVQCDVGDAGKNQPLGRGQVVIEDLEAWENNETQGVLWQVPANDLALINVRINSGSYPGISLGLSAGMDASASSVNWYYYNPKITGATPQVYGSRQNPAEQDAENIGIVLTEESSPNTLKDIRGYGQSVIHAGSTVDVFFPKPAPHPLIALLGNDVQELLDANERHLMPWATWPIEDLTKLDGGNLADDWQMYPGSANMIGGYSDNYPTRTRLTYSPNAFPGDLPCVVFPGTGGLGGANVGTMAGNGSYELWVLMSQDTPPSDATSYAVHAAGAGTGANARRLARTTTNRLSLAIDNVGATAPGTFSGLCIATGAYNGATLGIECGLIKQENPTLDPANYGTATRSAAAGTGNTRRGLGAMVNAHAATPFLTMKVHLLLNVRRVLTAAERQAVLDVFKARVGW